MPNLERIVNMRRLIQKLKDRKLASQANNNCRLKVGYTCPYAAFVHEKVGMVLQGVPRANGHGRYWDPQGVAEAKFLERAYRELMNSKVLIRRITEVMKSTHSLKRAIKAAGTLIKYEAQRRTPVDTGALKKSAFVTLE